MIHGESRALFPRCLQKNKTKQRKKNNKKWKKNANKLMWQDSFLSYTYVWEGNWNVLGIWPGNQSPDPVSTRCGCNDVSDTTFWEWLMFCAALNNIFTYAAAAARIIARDMHHPQVAVRPFISLIKSMHQGSALTSTVHTSMPSLVILL